MSANSCRPVMSFLVTQACTILGVFVPAGTDFGVKLLSNDKGKVFHSSPKPSFVTFGIEIPGKGQVHADHHGQREGYLVQQYYDVTIVPVVYGSEVE